ncbi:MAG TPA: aldehyde dehydrogenase family protein [Polyangiaceae bacterium]|nr:aldehyde dehydrogenase family protein [Polyangiaceae bacterium]
MPGSNGTRSDSVAEPVEFWQCTNPATGERIGQIEVMGAEAVTRAVTKARHAQASWGELGVKERAARVLGFCDRLIEHAEDLADLLVLETGKPRLEAISNEILVLADVIHWHAKHAPEILRPREERLHLLKHRKSTIAYVPRGVIAVISPWNYPLFLPLSEISLAVLAGNAVVLKPSEHASLVALKAKELWDTSELPSDLLQVVTGGAETARALLDAQVQKVSFTGSVEAGRKVAEQCGRNLVECVLELGGKAPLIVCADADIERAARAITWGGFSNMGQACVSVERVLAHTTVYDTLVQRTGELVRGLRQGAPEDLDIDVGAIRLERNIAHLEALVADAIAKGASVAAGGHRLERRGNFFAPTLLVDCSPDMRVMQEEIFGPLVPMMRVDSDDQALSVANSLPLGLSSYVFSRDTEHAAALARRIEAGSVVVNDVASDIASPEVPFGGIKRSGYGKVHGIEGLRSMCYAKHVSTNRTPLPVRSPFWFPYDSRDIPHALRGLRLLFTRHGPLGRLSKWL